MQQKKKAKNFVRKLKRRFFDSPVSAYLISSRGDSRKYFSNVGEGIEINENTFESHILGPWNADGWTYLWEFIFESLMLENLNDTTRCEIVIVTDGYDNQSQGLSF